MAVSSSAQAEGAFISLLLIFVCAAFQFSHFQSMGAVVIKWGH